MTMNPLRKLLEVFVLIIPQVIRVHFGEWEEVVLVCRPWRGMRIFVLIILQVIRIVRRIHEWEVVVLCRPRRGYLKIHSNSSNAETCVNDCNCTNKQHGFITSSQDLRGWLAPKSERFMRILLVLSDISTFVRDALMQTRALESRFCYTRLKQVANPESSESG